MWLLAMLLGCADRSPVDWVEAGDPGYGSERKEVLSESAVCFALVDRDGRDRTVAIGMDSGTAVELARIEGGRVGEIDSMAVIDTDAFACIDGSLTRIGLADGSTEDSGLACDAVTDLDGQLVIREGPTSELVRFGSSGDELAMSVGEPLDVRFAGKLGRRDGSLLAAVQDSPWLVSYDTETAQGNEFELEDFGTWVWGLSGAGQRLFVLTYAEDPLVLWNPRIAEFDPGGSKVHTWRLGFQVETHGLACSDAVEPF